MLSARCRRRGLPRLSARRRLRRHVVGGACVVASAVATVAGGSGAVAAGARATDDQTIILHSPVRFGMVKHRPVTLLGAELTLRAGESRRLFGQVDATGDTSATIEYAVAVRCRSGSAQVGPAAWASRNHTSTHSLALNPSLLFTAPRDGTYTCELLADGDGRATMTALADHTWLGVEGTGHVGAQWWQTPDCDDRGTLDSCTYLGGPEDDTSAYLLSDDGTRHAVWTAPAGATSADMNGNVELTTCYDNTGSCLPEEYGDARNSVVSSHLEAVQLGASGQPCNVTVGATEISTVDNPSHHYNIAYVLPHVPILPGCGSRQFVVRIAMQWMSGNPVKVDGTVPTPSAVAPEAQTYAFAVDQAGPAQN